jgi:hypothetical protein
MRNRFVAGSAGQHGAAPHFVSPSGGELTWKAWLGPATSRLGTSPHRPRRTAPRRQANALSRARPFPGFGDAPTGHWRRAWRTGSKEQWLRSRAPSWATHPWGLSSRCGFHERRLAVRFSRDNDRAAIPGGPPLSARKSLPSLRSSASGVPRTARTDRCAVRPSDMFQHP